MIGFFDIDGTLITEDERQYLPPSTVSAIQAMRRNGHLAFINTGRTLFNVLTQSYIQRIGFDGYVCACGTHIVYRGKDLLSVLVPEEAHDVITDAARRCRIELMFEGPEAFYFDLEQPMGPARRRLYDRDASRSLSVDLPHKRFNKFVTWDTPDCDAEAFVHAVSPWFVHIDRGGGFREFCLKGYSKATGITAIANLMDKPLDSCFVIGDSMNDEPMLRFVKHSVLMGNGTPALKPVVEFVTTDILDNGIEHALEHYGVI